MAPDTDPVWIFGYGSLIWRPDFVFHERHPGRVCGWTRRFWQASTDHRGTPAAPGRVVTLVAEPDHSCEGIVYGLDPAVCDDTLKALDHREQDGYERAELDVRLASGKTVSALTWIAGPANTSWLGAAPLDVMVDQIRTSRGPSGANRDYLIALDDALRACGIRDEHVTALMVRL